MGKLLADTVLLQLLITIYASCPDELQSPYKGSITKQANGTVTIHCDSSHMLAKGKKSELAIECKNNHKLEIPNCKPVATEAPYYIARYNRSIKGTVGKEISMKNCQFGPAQCSLECWKDVRCLQFNFVYNDINAVCQMLDVPFGIISTTLNVDFYENPQLMDVANGYCSQLTIGNATIAYNPANTQVPIYGTANVSCIDVSFQLTGPSFLTCVSHQQWDFVAPYCEEKNFENPGWLVIPLVSYLTRPDYGFEPGTKFEYLECEKNDLSESKPEYSVVFYSSVENQLYATLNSTATLKCNVGYYMTLKNPNDSLWYTTFSPSNVTCILGNWERFEENCSKIPDVIPVYSVFFPEPYDHYYTSNKTYYETTNGTKQGIAYFVLPSTAYCPEKVPVHMLYQHIPSVNNPNKANHYYTSNETDKNHSVAMGYAYEGVLGYVVKEKEQCGATKLLQQYYSSYTFDHFYIVNGQEYPFSHYVWQSRAHYVW